MTPRFPSSDPGVGDRLGGYRITGLVGRGGMAVVYAAVQESSGRPCALKLLLAHVDSEEVRGRFQREFRALSRLDHPNVIQVYEAGLMGDRPYYTMELLAGHDLRREMELWRDLALAERFRRAEDVLLQVSAALVHIHAQGLVHRDVSPSNIFVLHTGDVKIMDFGVVKEPGGDLTCVGELVGTVAYIAPEQFTGERVDERADLYSLGAVLYAMLTGRRPFHARTLAGYLEKHMHAAPRPPREVVPSVPEHLDEACMRLLSKSPAERFASASHLLHYIKQGAPISFDMKGGRWPQRTVGRAGELAQLREALSALESGRGGVLLLEGPAGSGKTRLIDDLAAQARDRGVKIYTGICRKEGGRAFSGYAQLYGALVADRAAAPAEVLRRVFVAEGEEGSAAPVERYAAFAAFLDLLRVQGRAVVVLENVHRADPSSLALTEYLVRNMLGLAKDPVLFVLSRWPVAEGPDPMAALVDGRSTGVGVERIPLGPLDVAAVEDLLLSIVPGDRSAGALARRVHREGEGNPQFIVEMIRTFVDERVIQVDEHGFARLRRDIGEITRSGLPLPLSLRHALRERLEPLSDEAREVGVVVALARQDVGLPLISMVTGMDEDMLVEVAEELVDAGVVRTRRVGEEERLDISQSGMRDVLLDSVDEAERKRLHRAIGAVLERLWRGRLGSVLEMVAWHFEQGDVPAKAYPYLVRAGEHLMARSLMAEALAVFDRAQQMEPVARVSIVLDLADRSLARLLLARSRAFAHLGRWDDADREVHKAHRIAGDLQDERLLAQTHYELGCMFRRHTDIDRAQEHFNRALELAEKVGDAALRINAINRMGALRWACDDLDGAKRAWIQVLALGETTQDKKSVAAGYSGLGLMGICRGQSAEARRYLESAAREYEALGAVDDLIITRINLMELYHLTGNLRRGLELADKAVAQSREIRHVEGIALGLRYRAMILVDLGRLEEAGSHVEDALRRVKEQGNLEEQLGCFGALARIAVYRNDWSDALRWLDAAEPLLARYDLEGVALILHAWRARVRAELGDVEGSLAAISRSDNLDVRRWPLHLVRCDLSIGRALARIGRHEEAMARAAQSLQRADAAGYRFYTFKAHKLLSGIALDPAVADRHARVARALARSLAANLSAEDSASFLAFHGMGEPQAS
ncbi:MAG: protein kinase [Pseudomonadota bacterium]